VSVFLINYIISIIEFKKFGYEILMGKNKSYDYLFKNECFSDIDFADVIGNQKEQIYFYKYKKEFDLIVWNISGFKDVDLTDIKFFASDDFEGIRFHPMRYTKMDIFEITSISENLEISQLTAYTNKEFYTTPNC